MTLILYHTFAQGGLSNKEKCPDTYISKPYADNGGRSRGKTITTEAQRGRNGVK